MKCVRDMIRTYSQTIRVLLKKMKPKQKIRIYYISKKHDWVSKMKLLYCFVMFQKMNNSNNFFISAK